MDLRKGYNRIELMTKKKNNLSKRQTGVIVEDLDKKLDLVLESYDVLRKELADFRTETKQEITDFRYEVRSELKFIGLAQSNFQNKLEDLKISSKQILEYLGRIDDEIQDLKKRLVAKADLEKLEKLEQRVARVELVVKKYDGKNSN